MGSDSSRVCLSEAYTSTVSGVEGRGIDARFLAPEALSHVETHRGCLDAQRRSRTNFWLAYEICGLQTAATDEYSLRHEHHIV